MAQNASPSTGVRGYIDRGALRRLWTRWSDFRRPMHAANQATRTSGRQNCFFWAAPNPAIAADFLAQGTTTLHWHCPGLDQIEIRSGCPAGDVIYRGGPTGEVTTGAVPDGTSFFLHAVHGTSAPEGETLAVVKLDVLRGRYFPDSLRPLPDSYVHPTYLADRQVGKALVAGYFSLDHGGATAGDLFTKDIVCDWLRDAQVSYDVAFAPFFGTGVDWRSVDVSEYSHVVFCCGPFIRQDITEDLLKRFAGARLVGVNLSMQMPLAEYNPFDVLIERDSTRRDRPDLSFLSSRPLVPVVGVIPVEPLAEYGHSGQHASVNAEIRAFLRTCEATVVEIDTRLDTNFTGLRTSAEVESLIAKMDVVITTRLHGMTLALKNGVPPIVIDPHSTPAKVARQALALGWPVLMTGADVTADKLQRAFDYCLTPAARLSAAKCSAAAREALSGAPELFRPGFLPVR